MNQLIYFIIEIYYNYYMEPPPILQIILGFFIIIIGVDLDFLVIKNY